MALPYVVSTQENGSYIRQLVHIADFQRDAPYTLNGYAIALSDREIAKFVFATRKGSMQDTVSIEGRVTIDNSGEMREKLANALKPKPGEVTVDFSRADIY